MTAVRRIRTKTVGAAMTAALLWAAPVAAQNSDAPVDVTAAPPPSNDSVGPAQLRNFNLGGTTTRPASNTATPGPQEPAPRIAAPPVVSSPPQPAAPRAAAPSSGATGRAPPTAAPSPREMTPATGGSATEFDPAQMPSTAEPMAEPVATPSLPSPDVATLSEGMSPWPWLSALLAALAVAGFWWWRRNRDERQADPGRLAFAGAVAEPEPASAPMPRAASPQPAPRHDPVPAPAPAPKPSSSGLITSTALQPELSVQMVPDRLAVSDREVLVQFDITISNIGSAAARDVLVEATMFTASAQQDQLIAEFFQAPRGEGDRMPGIAAMDSIQLKSIVRMPLDKVSTFEAGGRTLFVPLIAFNMLYRASSGEKQTSASFMIGRGKDETEKLAPFRTDLGPRIYRELSARAHSAGLAR